MVGMMRCFCAGGCSIITEYDSRAVVLGLVLLCVSAPFPAQAQPSWQVVKKYLQPSVEVVRETDEALVLRHSELQDTLVLTAAWHAEADVFSVLGRRQGGNPFRIWVATEQFWNNPARPKQMWGRYFRAEFLRLIRPPKPQDGQEAGR